MRLFLARFFPSLKRGYFIVTLESGVRIDGWMDRNSLSEAAEMYKNALNVSSGGVMFTFTSRGKAVLVNKSDIVGMEIW